MEPFIRQVLARAALGDSKLVARFAVLAYLRYDSRCRTNSDLREMPDDFLDSIPSHVNTCSFTMGASLFELMHRQQKSMPRCSIPFALYQICTFLGEHGAFTQQGIFQHTSSPGDVEKLAIDWDCGKDIFRGTDPKLVASLLKRWLIELPVSLIPPEVHGKLMAKKASMAFLPIIQELPVAPRNTLGYLVAFLKRLTQSEEKTKMGLNVVATMFGPLCSLCGFDQESKAKERAELGCLVLQTLIKDWDTSEYSLLDLD
jgi:hypothetical protein